MNDELKYFAFLPNLKIMDFRMKHHIQFILTLFNYYKNDYKILINFQFVVINLGFLAIFFYKF